MPKRKNTSHKGSAKRRTPARVSPQREDAPQPERSADEETETMRGNRSDGVRTRRGGGRDNTAPNNGTPGERRHSAQPSANGNAELPVQSTRHVYPCPLARGFDGQHSVDGIGLCLAFEMSGSISEGFLLKFTRNSDIENFQNMVASLQRNGTQPGGNNCGPIILGRQGGEIGGPGVNEQAALPAAGENVQGAQPADGEQEQEKLDTAAQEEDKADDPENV